MNNPVLFHFNPNLPQPMNFKSSLLSVLTIVGATLAFTACETHHYHHSEAPTAYRQPMEVQQQQFQDQEQAMREEEAYLAGQQAGQTNRVYYYASHYDSPSRYYNDPYSEYNRVGSSAYHRPYAAEREYEQRNHTPETNVVAVLANSPAPKRFVKSATITSTAPAPTRFTPTTSTASAATTPAPTPTVTTIPARFGTPAQAKAFTVPTQTQKPTTTYQAPRVYTVTPNKTAASVTSPVSTPKAAPRIYTAPTITSRPVYRPMTSSSSSSSTRSSSSSSSRSSSPSRYTGFKSR